MSMCSIYVYRVLKLFSRKFEYFHLQCWQLLFKKNRNMFLQKHMRMVMGLNTKFFQSALRFYYSFELLYMVALSVVNFYMQYFWSVICKYVIEYDLNVKMKIHIICQHVERNRRYLAKRDIPDTENNYCMILLICGTQTNDNI